MREVIVKPNKKEVGLRIKDIRKNWVIVWKNLVKLLVNRLEALLIVGKRR